MQKSLVKNSVFYMFYNLLNMLFPFITSIYVARILLPASVGEVAYAQNIVSYFSVLAFLGIPTYGVREIAKVRNNKKELSIVFSELFIINGISTFFFSAAYYFFVISVVAKNSNLLLYCVVGLTVILNMLNISWFFDCVYPSRNGRHGHVYTNHGKMNMFNAKYELDTRPIEEGCGCPACRHYSRAYIRHLLKAKEMLGMRLFCTICISTII